MKFLKKIAALTAVAIGIVTMTTAASARNISDWADGVDLFTPIKDSAVTVKSGKTYNATVKKFDDRANFKIVCKNAGTLTVEFEAAIEHCNIDLLDSKGNNIESLKCKPILGTVETDENNNAAFTWNKTKKVVKCSVQYKVNKGTYYLSLWRDEGLGTGRSKVKVSIPTSKISSYFTIDLRKGDSIKLDAGDGIKWSSSDTSVAVVSSDGKITGKSKGTAIITATDGTKKLKIAVKVK